MFGSIHEKAASDHFEKMSLEQILGTAFKSIFSGSNLPDTPFPTLYRTVNFYKTNIDIEKIREALKPNLHANEVIEEPFFGLGSLQSPEVIVGMKQMLELLDHQNVSLMRKRLAQCMMDIQNETQDVKFDVTHAIGGGYIMKSKVCKNPESSPEPLVIYSVFKASSTSFDAAYDVFFDYIHEDIKAMTRIDLDFNIFQKLILQYRDGEERIRKKKFILEEILNNKSRMHSEVMGSVKKRHLIATKVLMRVKDLDPKASYKGYKSGAGFSSSQYSNFGGGDTDENNYEYIPVKKVYIFHFVEKISKADVNFISYSSSSLSALIDGVFSSKAAAESYASFYMRKNEQIDKKNLSDYLENKYALVFSDYYKNELVKTLWGIIGMVMVETESVRYQILENIFAVLSHPISELLHLRSITRTIEVLIIANQNYGLSQFKTAIMYMYNKFQKQLYDVLATGFSPEILALRKYFDVLLSSISSENKKEIEINIHAVEAFRNISQALKTCCNSIATQIIDQNRVTKNSIDIVLKIMLENTNVKIITQRELIEKKKPDQVVVIKKEVETVSKSKKYPAKWANEHIYMQYVTDTFSFESVFFILRDIIMNPLYPNSLALCEYKLQGHCIRHDLYAGIPDELIIETDFNKPYKNPQPPTSMFIVGDGDMREKGIPFSISDYHTLFAASTNDIGLFRKFFKKYECSKALTEAYEQQGLG